MFTFNDDQKRVIDAGVQHLLSSSGDPVFEYSGEAGTGKSVVMHEIWKQSGIPMTMIAPMAYIGQAAIVMRLKGFPHAKTIHSWLYQPEIVTDRDDVDEYLGTAHSKLVFTPKPVDVKAYFIDEGGTVPLKMRQDLVNSGKRIIVAGDANQLPPVKDDPAFLYDPKRIMFLTQVMRQKVDSGIIFIAKKCLRGEPIPNGFYGDALVIYEDELTDDLLRGADMVLCSTNKTRDRYTHIIREQVLGIRDTLPRFGERVICRKNNWRVEVDGIGLGNGITGMVASPPEISSMNDMKSKGKRACFLMDFQPNLFNGVFYDLEVNYDFFFASSKEKQKIKTNPYTQGNLFEFAYINTVHLTQGAQYNNVIYIEEPNIFDQVTQCKLNYTACTRAANKLIYVKKRIRQYYS